MVTRLHQVNAFVTGNVLTSGNPASVCMLAEGSDPTVDQMTVLARELRMPVTAFVTSIGSGGAPNSVVCNLRVFTDGGIELPLCGHGTLAAAAAVQQGMSSSPCRYACTTQCTQARCQLEP
mmetsp:Transcript_21169/g.63709  ORF Transcript_21169/g.63709 Transcript_21169/m.63709 type:complete len:121 (-) Transcript_21169:23-385(-)